MKIEGWEWRTLPEDKGRLGRWKGQHGLWLVRREGFSGVVADVSGAVGRRPGMMMRPLSAGGEIVPWDEWAEKTHPDPPEGYRRRGGWAESTRAGQCKAWATMLLDDGRIVPEGALFTHVGYVCTVEQVAPPVTWADVPAGVEVNGNGTVTRDGCHIGWIRQNTQRQPCVWEWGAFENFETKHRGDHVKFVAAIVALIKAAEGEG